MNDEERIEWDMTMFLLGDPYTIWSWWRPFVLMGAAFPVALWLLTPPVWLTILTTYEWVSLAVLASAVWVGLVTLAMRVELTIPTTSLPVIPPLFIGVLTLWTVTIMQFAPTPLAWMAVCGLLTTQFILTVETLRMGGMLG